MTAPSETPTVMAVFARPIYSPLFFGLVICIAMMLATMNIPPPPAPVTTRPMMKWSKVVDVEVIIEPMLMRMVDENMQKRGLKT